jgi:hypothetical protein
VVGLCMCDSNASGPRSAAAVRGVDFRRVAGGPPGRCTHTLVIPATTPPHQHHQTSSYQPLFPLFL